MADDTTLPECVSKDIYRLNHRFLIVARNAAVIDLAGAEQITGLPRDLLEALRDADLETIEDLSEQAPINCFTARLSTKYWKLVASYLQNPRAPVLELLSNQAIAQSCGMGH